MNLALQVKTSYSLLESLNDITKLVLKAKELGYTSLAITDHNNMFGVMEFYLECRKNDIKPIIGLELAVDDLKILLYAKNNLGYKNLIKLSTIVSDRNVTVDDLVKFRDNLILIMPYSFYDEGIFNIYNDHYLGYFTQEEKEKINGKKVFINDVSYLNKDDYKYLDYLYMINLDKKIGSYELNTHKNKHLYSLDEYKNIVSEEDIKTCDEIVSMCEVEIGYNPDLLPVYDMNIDAYSYLVELCNKGLKKRLNNNVSKIYQDRLDYELDVINKMGFCNYFLIVWDYVKYAKFNDILVGPGRGSAAGSLVSYTLGITDIDPLKYDLLFERFLNPERITMPDIDIDFDSERRSEVIDYVINKYGEKKVVGIITFNTLGVRQVLRDVGRVLDISVSSIDAVCKMAKKNTLEECYLSNKEFKAVIDNNSTFKKLYDIAIHLEGLPRHVSIHAAGIVMSKYDMDETIPLYKSPLGMYVTAYSMNYLESLGLLKMDFLGISNLTLIDHVIRDIRSKEKLNITFSRIPLTDKKTFKIFSSAYTDGIFQFESVGMKKFLRKLEPNCFEDIVAALALYRPGPMDNIDTYIKRKNKKEEVDYIDPCLENILKPTYGIIIYQEQIMQIAQVLAGYTLAEADSLRRAMSKKKEDILIKEEPKFIKRSMEKGHSREISERVYKLILKFANYGFNKSHSVGYATVACKMAFLKTYFYKYFMNYLLTNSIGSETKTKTYINECRINNIKVFAPNINKSTNQYEIVEDGIICPLSIIKGVGTVGSNMIINERKKDEFVSFIDFIKRAYKAKIGKKLVENLIYAGCFYEFGYNKRTLIENLDDLFNYAELNEDSTIVEIEIPEMVIYGEYSKEELIDIEFRMFGFYLVEHPVSKYREGENTLLELEDLYAKEVSLILKVNSIREVVTKKNDVMAFIKGSDEYSFIDMVLFPNIYKKYNDITNGNIIRVFGVIERRYDQYQLVVRRLDILE